MPAHHKHRQRVQIVTRNEFKHNHRKSYLGGQINSSQRHKKDGIDIYTSTACKGLRIKAFFWDKLSFQNPLVKRLKTQIKPGF